MIMGLQRAVVDEMPCIFADIFASRAVSIQHFLSKDEMDKDIIAGVNQTLSDT